METNELIDKNNKLIDDINKLLELFTDENKMMYLKKINELLNKFKEGKSATNEITLFTYTPEQFNRDLENIKNELNNKIENKTGIITPFHKYKKIFEENFKFFYNNINNSGPGNLNSLINRISVGNDFIKNVGLFLNDDSISATEKEKCYEIILDTFILIFSNDFWSEHFCDGFTDLDLLNKYKDINNFDYSDFINYVEKKVENKEYIINLEVYLRLKGIKDTEKPINYLTAIIQIFDYKQVLSKYKEKTRDRKEMITYITSELQYLDNETLTQIYETIRNRNENKFTV